jgi:Nicotinate-nucleotide pyrophosphorylase
VSLKNIKKIAETGIDRVSIGEITHSVRALDLKLEI